MHRLAKKLSILLAALITFSALAAIVPVMGSTGNIHINDKDATPIEPNVVTINIGQNISLYFGDVTWSGGQVDLYLSADGYASLTIPGDIRYGPTFTVAQISASGLTPIKEDDLRYTVGYDWINGTVPEALEIAGGKYYVKAFDGATAAVAVTDYYFMIRASFEVVPSWGPGQADIKLEGYALPSNDYANLSYYHAILDADNVTIKNLVPANDVGRFTYSMIAPDLEQAMAIGGPRNETYGTAIKFYMVVNGTGQSVMFEFKEYYRGLKQAKGVDVWTGKTGVLAPTWADGVEQLYGNETDLSASVDVEVKGDLIVAGKWFHPGTVTIRWEFPGTTVLGTATANSTHGWFNTTVPIPVTSKGKHNVTIDDGKTLFYFKVNVVPTLILVPDEGPVGTHVTAYGYGFDKTTSDVLYNVTLVWDYTTVCGEDAFKNKTLGYVKTEADGSFITAFDVPASIGGERKVTATANQSGDAAGEFTGTTASDIFTVKPTLSVTPIDFTNDGSKVTVVGSGLGIEWWYDLCLDNTKDFYAANIIEEWNWTVLPGNGYDYWPEYLGKSAVTSYFQPNCTGYFEFEFIAAGFQPGTHVVTLYKVETSHQLPAIEGFRLFTVWEETPVLDKLDEIEETLDDIQDAVMEIDFAGVEDKLDDVIAELAALGDIEGTLTTVIQHLTDIKALSETAASQATTAATEAGSASTSAQAAEDAAEAANTTVGGISMAVYGAVIMSVVAALASVIAVITLQRKVA